MGKPLSFSTKKKKHNIFLSQSGLVSGSVIHLDPPSLPVSLSLCGLRDRRVTATNREASRRARTRPCCRTTIRCGCPCPLIAYAGRRTACRLRPYPGRGRPPSSAPCRHSGPVGFRAAAYRPVSRNPTLMARATAQRAAGRALLRQAPPPRPRRHGSSRPRAACRTTPTPPLPRLPAWLSPQSVSERHARRSASLG